MANKKTNTPISGTDTYSWSASGSGTNEYYLVNSSGAITEPTNVLEGGSAMTSGTAGSLTAGQWDWADNDTLGYSTVYVRLTSGGPDPDDEAFATLVAEFVTTLAKSNLEIADNILLVDDLPITSVSVANNDFSVVALAANGNRQLVQITNESGSDMYIAWTDTQPVSTDTMRKVVDGETVWFSILDGLPKSALYVYQNSGGALNLKVGEAEIS